MTKDIIMERFDAGLCPICNKELGADFKRVEHKGKKVWIHKHHPAKLEDSHFQKIGTG